MKKIQGAFLKWAFAIIYNNLINFKSNKIILDSELRFHLSDLIMTCTESLVFLQMKIMEGDNIRRQYLSNMLP